MLDPAAEGALKGFEPVPFAEMIDDWKRCIDQKLDTLRDARIR